jgi:hypothetical protein
MKGKCFFFSSLLMLRKQDIEHGDTSSVKENASCV